MSSRVRRRPRRRRRSARGRCGRARPRAAHTAPIAPSRAGSCRPRCWPPSPIPGPCRRQSQMQRSRAQPCLPRRRRGMRRANRRVRARGRAPAPRDVRSSRRRRHDACPGAPLATPRTAMLSASVQLPVKTISFGARADRGRDLVAGAVDRGGRDASVLGLDARRIAEERVQVGRHRRGDGWIERRRRVVVEVDAFDAADSRPHRHAALRQFRESGAEARAATSPAPIGFRRRGGCVRAAARTSASSSSGSTGSGPSSTQRSSAAKSAPYSPGQPCSVEFGCRPRPAPMRRRAGPARASSRARCGRAGWA